MKDPGLDFVSSGWLLTWVVRPSWLSDLGFRV